MYIIQITLASILSGFAVGFSITVFILEFFNSHFVLVLGEFVSDPDLCKLGLTVSFWLKTDQKNLDYFEKEKNYTYSYILSTGGQRSDSK